MPIKNGTGGYRIPETFLIDGEEAKGNDYTDYLVTGNSMYPEGISNGDYLLIKKSEQGKFDEGDFLIIKVDREYTKKYRKKVPLYDYKLRKALLRVTPSMEEKDIIEKLKDTHFEINLKENQNDMRKKLKENRGAYPEKDLMFSITYHDGKLCYSFHPVDLIVGRAAVQVRLQNGEECYKSL